MNTKKDCSRNSHTELEQRLADKDVALVVLDIATRAVNKPYSYRIPEHMRDELTVGCMVLVRFGHRRALGYVVDRISISDALRLVSADEQSTHPHSERNAAQPTTLHHVTPKTETLVQESLFAISEPQIDLSINADAEDDLKLLNHGEVMPPHTCFQEESSCDRKPSAHTHRLVDTSDGIDHNTLDDVLSSVNHEGAQRFRCIERMMSQSLFDAEAYATAQFISHEYACTLLDALKLFLPPGAQSSLVKDKQTGVWTLRQSQVGPVDDRWALLTPQGDSYIPSSRAVKQRRVLEVLQQGPQRIAEISSLIPGARSVLKTLEKKGVIEIEHRRRMRQIGDTKLSSAHSKKRSEAELTAGQRSALKELRSALDRACGDVVVLDGVTGSGKTEVYLNIIDECLARNKGAYVLVPEISLTPQTVGRFRGRFGNRVAVLHSKLSLGERYDQWDLVRDGSAQVVVGARSALFAPLKNPGIIVIDEEHEYTYKQSSTPRYHAREVAAYIASRRGCPLVLGSATPSIEVLHRCRQDQQHSNTYIHVTMSERANALPLPETHIVDMTAEFAAGHRSMFSRCLTSALHDVVEKQEKAVLLLNRRGFAHFLLCRECGYVPRCDQCSTSLTYHAHTHQLICHTCGATHPVYSRCPKCQSPYLKAFGTGTQRVEDELKLLLEDAVPIIRMDADSTRTKGGHERTLEAFDSAPSAILLGTQMIAKGLDFPEVTLAGVINADTVLKMPDFRAAERTFSLLEQIAGRAGRGEKPGQVIIQTYWPNHPALRSVAQHNRDALIAHEYLERQEASYPPFVRLGRILIWGPDENRVKVCAQQITDALRVQSKHEFKRVLGPVPCLIEKAKNNYRYHILVKAAPECSLGEVLSYAVTSQNIIAGVNCAIDIDPYDLM